jgi:hypothetical protein
VPAALSFWGGGAEWLTYELLIYFTFFILLICLKGLVLLEKACETDAKKRCPSSVSFFDTACAALCVLRKYMADISRGILV